VAVVVQAKLAVTQTALMLVMVGMVFHHQLQEHQSLVAAVAVAVDITLLLVMVALAVVVLVADIYQLAQLRGHLIPVVAVEVRVEMALERMVVLVL
jgi:hypothetical protein